MRELVTGPSLLENARHDFIYRKTTEVGQDDRGNVIPQSHITKRLGWCVYSVTPGTLAGEPVRVIRWFYSNGQEDLEHRFYVTESGDLLRQVSQSARPVQKMALVTVTPEGLQCQVSEPSGRRSFELVLKNLDEVVGAFRPLGEGTKTAAIFDPFRNAVKTFTIRKASFWTDSWSGRTYRGEAYDLNESRLYLTDAGKPFRRDIGEFTALEPDVELLRSK